MLCPTASSSSCCSRVYFAFTIFTNVRRDFRHAAYMTYYVATCEPNCCPVERVEWHCDLNKDSGDILMRCIACLLTKHLVRYDITSQSTATVVSSHITCHRLVSMSAGDTPLTVLFQCLPLTSVQLLCSSGQCRHILSGSADRCPLRCSIHDQCFTCLATPGCGWCAFSGLNGRGVCMKGGLRGPIKGVCSVSGVSLEDEALSGESLSLVVVVTSSMLCSIQM